jgi:hypothetical protein
MGLPVMPEGETGQYDLEKLSDQELETLFDLLSKPTRSRRRVVLGVLAPLPVEAFARSSENGAELLGTIGRAPSHGKSIANTSFAASPKAEPSK